jgi:hypothetical protein
MATYQLSKKNSGVGIEFKDLQRTKNKRPFYIVWKDRSKSPCFEKALIDYLRPVKEIDLEDVL